MLQKREYYLVVDLVIPSGVKINTFFLIKDTKLQNFVLNFVITL